MDFNLFFYIFYKFLGYIYYLEAIFFLICTKFAVEEIFTTSAYLVHFYFSTLHLKILRNT